jgi:hypothetical protein
MEGAMGDGAAPEKSDRVRVDPRRQEFRTGSGNAGAAALVAE